METAATFTLSVRREQRPATIHGSEEERLTDVLVSQLLVTVEVGDRSRHLEHAMEAPRGQTGPLGGCEQEGPRIGCDRSVRIEPSAGDSRIAFGLGEGGVAA